MSSFLMSYIFISVIIGTFYFNYWYYHLQTSNVIYSRLYKRVIIYITVILLSMILSPITLADLIVYYIRKRKEEKQ